MRRVLVLTAMLAACSNGGATTSMVAACPTEGKPFDTAKLYIEHNATDADTGVHGLFGGAAWSELCLTDPTGREILVVDPRAQLGDLRVADLFFESREPPNDEYTIAALMEAFPEGEYVVSGTDFEGVARVGSAFFTHSIPAPPVILGPALGDDEEAGATVVVPVVELVVEWEPVRLDLDGRPVTVVGYEVIVTKVEHDDPNGLSAPVYDVHVGPSVTALPVPEEFLEAGALYELEVLALETSGNQTISLGFFTTT